MVELGEGRRLLAQLDILRIFISAAMHEHCYIELCVNGVWHNCAGECNRFVPPAHCSPEVSGSLNDMMTCGIEGNTNCLRMVSIGDVVIFKDTAKSFHIDINSGRDPESHRTSYPVQA